MKKLIIILFMVLLSGCYYEPLQREFIGIITDKYAERIMLHNDIHFEYHLLIYVNEPMDEEYDLKVSKRAYFTKEIGDEYKVYTVG